MRPDLRGGWRDLSMLFPRAVALVWQAGRREFLLVASLQLFVALGAAAQLIVARSVIGALIGSHERGFAQTLPSLAALFAILAAVDVAQSIEAEQSRVLAELVTRHALNDILEVVSRADLLRFESATFYDRIRRAQNQSQYRVLQIVQGLLGMLGASIASIAVVVTLATMQPVLLPIAIVGYVPLWFVTRRNSQDFYQFTWGMTPNDRQRLYLQSVMLGRQPAKELRAFQLAPYFRLLHENLYRERIEGIRALARRRTLRAVAAGLANSLVIALTVGAVAWLLATSRVSLAVAGTTLFGLMQLGLRLRTFHASTSSLYEATLFMRDYANLIDEPQPLRPVGRAPEILEGLVAHDVTFTYPQATQPAVDCVSLEIRAGEIVGLVGENGSGKTTLAKLLAGLYPAQAGAIYWNGADITNMDPDDLRRHIAVIFQDFERYLLSAEQNIGIGRYSRLDDDLGIVAAALNADADSLIKRLPEGYGTLLGPEFYGGYDLSVGEWQRIALARALFRDAPLVILDEPTSALDARAESNLFERMRVLLAGRSALLISHRFSSVRLADRIYVLSAGRVIEHGTHDELVAADGLYCELFRLQAAAYLGKKETSA